MKEAHKHELRVIPKAHWDALNKEYLVYKHSLVDEVVPYPFDCLVSSFLFQTVIEPFAVQTPDPSLDRWSRGSWFPFVFQTSLYDSMSMKCQNGGLSGPLGTES